MFYLCKFRNNSSILFIPLLSILLIEYYTLYFYRLFLWRLPQNHNSTVFLIIADPQLLGYRHESSKFGWLTRWDSDRYMRRNYEVAISSIRPTVEVFLGDLFDEGVECSGEEFRWTKDRFMDVFKNDLSIHRIFVSGDNDVGGEMEPVFPHLESRFNAEFSNRIGEELEKNFSIYTANLFKDGKFVPIVELTNNSFKVLLSHVPILPNAFSYLQQQLESYAPNLIFSGHEHTVSVYVEDRQIIQSDEFFYTFQVNNSQPVEFQSPTVSYRMGVLNMGFGVVEITPTTDSPLEFSIAMWVIWLPQRFLQLYIYSAIIILSTAIYLLFKRISRNRWKYNLIC